VTRLGDRFGINLLLSAIIFKPEDRYSRFKAKSAGMAGPSTTVRETRNPPKMMLQMELHDET
jgi:hypothetical protein